MTDVQNGWLAITPVPWDRWHLAAGQGGLRRRALTRWQGPALNNL